MAQEDQELKGPEIELPDSWLGVYNDVVVNVMQKKFKLKESLAITPSTSLKEHLDSLDLVELTMEAEDRYGFVNIPDDALAAMKDLGDFVTYICFWRKIPGDRSDWTPPEPAAKEANETAPVQVVSAVAVTA